MKEEEEEEEEEGEEDEYNVERVWRGTTFFAKIIPENIHGRLGRAESDCYIY